MTRCSPAPGTSAESSRPEQQLVVVARSVSDGARRSGGTLSPSLIPTGSGLSALWAVQGRRSDGVPRGRETITLETTLASGPVAYPDRVGTSSAPGYEEWSARKVHSCFVSSRRSLSRFPLILSRYRDVKKAGFTVIEMVAALLIMGVFLLISGTLWMQCVGAFGKTASLENRQALWSQMVHRLGRDVWTARKIEMKGARELICRYGSQDWVDWRVQRRGVIRRIRWRARLAGWPVTWTHFGAVVRFGPTPKAVQLLVFRHGRQRTITLPAELRLLQALAERER